MYDQTFIFHEFVTMDWLKAKIYLGRKMLEIIIFIGFGAVMLVSKWRYCIEWRGKSGFIESIDFISDIECALSMHKAGDGKNQTTLELLDWRAVLFITHSFWKVAYISYAYHSFGSIRRLLYHLHSHLHFISTVILLITILWTIMYKERITRSLSTIYPAL